MGNPLFILQAILRVTEKRLACLGMQGWRGFRKSERVGTGLKTLVFPIAMGTALTFLFEKVRCNLGL
jgi:hypothetical protein